jgi:hypothetical protein
LTAVFGSEPIRTWASRPGAHLQNAHAECSAVDAYASIARSLPSDGKGRDAVNVGYGRVGPLVQQKLRHGVKSAVAGPPPHVGPPGAWNMELKTST